MLSEPQGGITVLSTAGTPLGHSWDTPGAQLEHPWAGLREPVALEDPDAALTASLQGLAELMVGVIS